MISHLRPGAALLLIVACFGAPRRGKGEPFAFRVRDGTVLAAVTRREITTELGGGDKQVAVEDTTAEWRFKRTPAGWDLGITQKSAARTVNGAPFQNPAANSVLLGRTLTSQLDAGGQFIRLTGHFGLADEMKKRFPQAVPALLEATLAPALLERAQKRSWWLHAARLLGHDATPGARWKDRQDFPGERPAGAWSLSVVTGAQPAGERLLTTVLAFISSDPALLPKLEAAPDLTSLAAPEVKDFLEWNVAELPLQKLAVRLVIDARTLLPAEEEVTTVRVSTVDAGLQTQTEVARTKYAAPGH